MSINPTSYSQFARILPSATAPRPGFATATAQSNNSRQDLLSARQDLLAAYEALQTLAEKLGAPTRFSLDLPDARSTAALGLDLSTSAVTLASTGEINSSPMSFTPFGPDWDLLSSAPLTIGGEYDGTHGDGNLTFEVRRPGVRGINDLRIRVYDPAGNRIRNFNVRSDHSLDQQYDLRNGLYVTVGDGLLLNRDTASIQLSTSTGEVFNPDLPFNGLRNSNPNFQYYASPNTLDPVVNGSFLLNGEAISVGAGDTLTQVIDRINASTAGVTAAYDSGSERLEFLQDTPGSAPTIDLQSDTSNLLAALKLDTAIVMPGTDPESEVALQDVSAFSAVQGGNITINGTDIAIDETSDSLVDIVARINQSGAGVTAQFDAIRQEVVIENVSAEGVLELTDNGTGLFAALNVPEGRVDPEAIGGGLSRRQSYAIADELESVFASLSKVFQDRNFQDGADHTGVFRNLLANAVGDFFGERGGNVDGAFGLSFDLTGSGRQRGSFASVERRDFTADLQQRGGSVKRLLAGHGDRAGLIEALGSATVLALRNVSSALGQRGNFVDTFA